MLLGSIGRDPSGVCKFIWITPTNNWSISGASKIAFWGEMAMKYLTCPILQINNLKEANKSLKQSNKKVIESNFLRYN